MGTPQTHWDPGAVYAVATVRVDSISPTYSAVPVEGRDGLFAPWPKTYQK